MLDANFADVWEALADSLGSHDAIVQGERRLTLGDLETRASRLAGALQAHGVGAGGKVGMVLYNCPEFFEVMFAAFKLRAVPVAFNYRFRGPELSAVLADSDSKVAFVHASLATEIDEVFDDLGGVGWWVHVPDGSPEPDWSTTYQAALEADPAPRSSAVVAIASSSTPAAPREGRRGWSGATSTSRPT